MKLQKKQYILECWNCKSKIIYSHSDCNYDDRYHSYELKCPNCQQRYSTERRELFHREYKTEDNITIDQLTNNWNELEEHIIERIKFWEEQEKEWIKQGFMKFGGEANNKIILQGLLGKMKEIKERGKL